MSSIVGKRAQPSISIVLLRAHLLSLKLLRQALGLCVIALL
jgi:hypothetical protein